MQLRLEKVGVGKIEFKSNIFRIQIIKVVVQETVINVGILIDNILGYFLP